MMPVKTPIIIPHREVYPTYEKPKFTILNIARKHGSYAK